MSSMDEFLNHKSRSSGGGGSFLGNWKKEGKINVWLHTRINPIAVWHHQMPKYVTRKEGDDEEEVRHVWGEKYVCHEDEDVLLKQYFRDKETGERKVPPRRCPVCKLLEHVRSLVEEGKLQDVSPVFKFEGDVEKETRIMHAAGLYGGFPKSQRDASSAQLKAYRAAEDFRLADAWQENVNAKSSYAFNVVVDDEPGEGVQIAIETGSLGDAVKDVIADSIESLGKEDGNPQLHPFAIQWVYIPKEESKTAFAEYKARKMERLKLTPGIEKLIRGPKPDMTSVVTPFNVKMLRAVLERACLVPKLIPWDELFAEPAKRGSESEETGIAHDAEQDEHPEAEDDDEIECDVCKKGMKQTEFVCPHCASEYDPDTGALLVKGKVPGAPPKQMKKRGEGARKAKKKDDGEEPEDGMPF